MKFNEFALKYPEVVKQVQNLVFPCYYKEIRVKDATQYVEALIEDDEFPIIDMFAVKDSLGLYDIDKELFEDYKHIQRDLYILLENVSKHKADKDLD